MGGTSAVGLKARAVLKPAAIREEGSLRPPMLSLMLTLPITARQQRLTSFIVETATVGHKTTLAAASLPTPPFSTSP